MKPLKASDITTVYTPTAEDKERVKIVQGKFKLTGDGVFHTIQWEWQFAGRPTTFVRLHHCNLQCQRCDARYSRMSTSEEFYKEPFDLDIDALQEYIEKAQAKYNTTCRDITITGGEPLLQQRTIIAFLEKYGHNYDRIQIETNGTIHPLPELANNEKVFYNCSPKLHFSGNNRMMAYKENTLKLLQDTGRVIFKFVVKDIESLHEIAEVYPYINRDLIRVMPEGVLVEEHRQVFDNIIDDIVSTGYNVAIRCQSIMRDWAKRWV